MKIIKLLIILLFAISCGSTKEFTSEQKIQEFSNGKLILEDGKEQKVPKFRKKNQTIIYLVRHAEKEKTKGDVHLTSEGRERAKRLRTLMSENGLDMVYSTRFNRTQETAEPSATLHNLNIQEYHHGKLEEFSQNLLDEHRGKKILVVGHSNTTPDLLNIFMGEKVKGMIDESDYENLYIISISSKGKAQALLTKY